MICGRATGRLLIVWSSSENDHNFEAKTLISSDSELYRIGKMFLEKLLQNEICKYTVIKFLAISKYSLRIKN